MKTLNLTQSTVQNEIYYHEDSAYLDSTCFESSENDDIFNQVVNIASEMLSEYDFIEIESHGRGSRAIWHKITE